MTESCVPPQELSLPSQTRSDRAGSRHFVLGLAISALIWASLAAGTRMAASWLPATDTAQLILSR